MTFPSCKSYLQNKKIAFFTSHHLLDPPLNQQSDPSTCRGQPSSEILESRGRTGVGLDMCYSVVFTELITISPESSILLQIMRITHMTLWIKRNQTDPVNMIY